MLGGSQEQLQIPGWGVWELSPRALKVGATGQESEIEGFCITLPYKRVRTSKSL